MGQRIECSVRIMAPREVVWATIQNVARRSEWDARVVKAHLVTEPPPRRGTRFRVVYRALGLPTWIELEYSVWLPPERSAVRAERFSRGSPVAWLGGSWHFHDNGDGSTGWTTVVNMHLHGGLLSPVLERIFVRGYFQRLTAQSQQNLKQLIEAEYVCPPRIIPVAPRGPLLDRSSHQGL
jgi:hypothetical protein